jgi:ABC-type branched-subunit amino acid transport system ATPase component
MTSAVTEMRAGQGAVPAGTVLLAAENVSAGYGGREVFSGVTLELPSAEVVCLIGHNGAGKSTLLKVMFGLHRPTAGTVKLRGTVVTPVPAAMAAQSVAYVPEGRGIFPGLTVKEIFTLAMWSARLDKGEVADRIEDVLQILPRLRTLWTRRAGNLSGGQQQMVSIGRALLSRPSILLLDEPSIGLAPKLFQDLLTPVRAVQKERGMSILLVEQNVHEAFVVSDRVVVMKSGQVIFRGVPADLSDSSRLMELF